MAEKFTEADLEEFVLNYWPALDVTEPLPKEFPGRLRIDKRIEAEGRADDFVRAVEMIQRILQRRARGLQADKEKLAEAEAIGEKDCFDPFRRGTTAQDWVWYIAHEWFDPLPPVAVVLGRGLTRYEEVTDPDYREADPACQLYDAYLWIHDEIGNVIQEHRGGTVVDYTRAKRKPPTTFACVLLENYAEQVPPQRKMLLADIVKQVAKGRPYEKEAEGEELSAQERIKQAEWELGMLEESVAGHENDE